MADVITLDRMHRNPDRETSVDAAAKIEPRRTWLQGAIYQALITHGDMTDGELERLAQFSGFGPSTVRKRRSELYKDGRVVATTERRGGMTVWRALP